MKTIYKISPLLIFTISYFIWTNNSPLVLAGNALVVLAFVMILALIPAGIIYTMNKKKRKHPGDGQILDQEVGNGPNQSFYEVLSKYTFYIGLIICVGLIIMKMRYSG